MQCDAMRCHVVAQIVYPGESMLMWVCENKKKRKKNQSIPILLV
jgi:hypothetical protein